MRKALNRHADWLRSKSFVIGIAGLAGLCAIFLAGLNQPSQLSQREYVAVSQGTGWGAIARDPLSAPFTILQTIFSMITNSNVAVRLPAVMASMTAVYLLYRLVLRWHGKRVALMTAGLFAASGWLLHTGRIGLPLALYSLMPLTLFMFGSWLNVTKRSWLAIALTGLVFAGLLYVPGAIWFEAVSVLLLWPVWSRHLKMAPQAIWLAVAGWLTVAGWLIFCLVRQPALIMEWLGVHDGVSGSFMLLKQWLQSGGFFVHGPLTPDLWLGRAPLLDIFSLAVLALGAYVYIRHNHNLRARLIAGFTLVASVLVAVNGFTGLSYLLPMLYMLIAAGIAFLLHEWYVIFPRNPLARAVGTAAILVAVGCAGAYHISAYFIAWQRAPETTRAFNRPLP